MTSSASSPGLMMTGDHLSPSVASRAPPPLSLSSSASYLRRSPSPRSPAAAGGASSGSGRSPLLSPVTAAAARTGALMFTAGSAHDPDQIIMPLDEFAQHVTISNGGLAAPTNGSRESSSSHAATPTTDDDVRPLRLLYTVRCATG